MSSTRLAPTPGSTIASSHRAAPRRTAWSSVSTAASANSASKLTDQRTEDRKVCGFAGLENHPQCLNAIPLCREFVYHQQAVMVSGFAALSFVPNFFRMTP
jgi:hypothetical protein